MGKHSTERNDSTTPESSSRPSRLKSMFGLGALLIAAFFIPSLILGVVFTPVGIVEYLALPPSPDKIFGPSSCKIVNSTYNLSEVMEYVNKQMVPACYEIYHWEYQVVGTQLRNSYDESSNNDTMTEVYSYNHTWKSNPCRMGTSCEECIDQNKLRGENFPASKGESTECLSLREGLRLETKEIDKINHLWNCKIQKNNNFNTRISTSPTNDNNCYLLFDPLIDYEGPFRQSRNTIIQGLCGLTAFAILSIISYTYFSWLA